MSRFLLTPRAREDLEEIEAYIAHDSPDAARRVILELQTAMQRLAESPGLGHRRSDIDDPRYRFWVVYSYLIVYIPQTDPLQIIRVVNGYRNLPTVLKK
ncbi:MAG TPA: type II toxin-antitoxin system RelE/ParE family toxin [Phycisphaerae bacterium]|jgi:plasmid stabilization system protein ParE|nr:type II toxin-antitoxin system RelE/ParE family toxin [Phycisphaerae bacterium]HOB74059.1 type II toxin-antitoxin system RelE/ParE family toxin [Phycisphaerae bacterium]HOJ53810.1 type II toxin-antitoxin system RelE/ParE family toxin [Phycisphaerae bacterium]HOL26141.1 type II toxin-antitoxin system RelE/ParE family toxin [Phycisphaerae bacterium]HPP20128.1 type II toxin-antitoxin system RelE/ParE family toxin [Phycisphaerae bacterium]